jgi:hypothetical protein
MSSSTRRLSSFTIAFACALCVCGPALAGEGAASCEPLGFVQKRVVEKASVGVEALRNYVEITRGIHQLTMKEVAASLDTWAANARCAGLVANEEVMRRVVAVAATTR